MADVPIDISVRKLLEWLISRRICSRDWHEKAVKIREKIGEAMQDMPENDKMKELLLGTHINYFHCLKIVDILKETEADSKNFFGQYGSKRMIDWKKIISDYQSGDVYLAEAAQILIQNVVYEVPGIKKHNLKLEQTQADCDKRELNANKRISELEDEFKKQCRDLGIDGVKLKSEIVSLARDLPSTYTQLASDCVSLKEACRLYQDFIKDNLDEGIQLKVLENLQFLIEEGNVTTYQWKYGEKPISVEEPRWDVLLEDEDNVENDGGIDFGDGNDDGEIDFGGGDDDAIDFGDDATVEIDFGDDGAEIDFGEADAGGGGGIDFDIDGVDTSAIVVEEGGMAGGVAREEEALSILDNRRTRTLILDELEELAGFLTQRLCEAENENLQFSLGSGEQNHDPATLRNMLGLVEGLVASLTQTKVQQLQMIRDSPAYADRLADTLKQKLRLKQKVVSSIDDIKQKRREAAEEREAGLEQVKGLQRRNGELQKEIEADISKRYSGRKVFVSGM